VKNAFDEREIQLDNSNGAIHMFDGKRK